MTLNSQQIQCPHCAQAISIDDVFTRPLKQQLEKELLAKQQEKEHLLAQEREQLKQQAQQLQQQQNTLESEIRAKLQQQLALEKIKLEKTLHEQAQQHYHQLTVSLEQQLQTKEQALNLANQKEIEWIQQKSQWQDQKRQFELEKIQQLEQEKIKLSEEANKKAEQKYHYIIAQSEKKLQDVTKAKNELSRKLEQGSQQTQGEVLELELESLLKNEFPSDEILPVAKGSKGADIIQQVFDRQRRACGQIVWEIKQTKNWNEHWIQKLKDDQRASKAEVAVIVSAVLPDKVSGFIFRDGVWICEVKLVTALATALRLNLQAITQEKAQSVGKNEKMEVLYGYLTGIEFKQRVEAIIEAFSSLDESLRKERLAFEKIWCEREKQIKKVISNTAGMYGDLSGLVALPQMKVLELE